MASASPRRLELLLSLGLDVRVVPSGYHEPDRADLSPLDLALDHARAKCEAVAMRFPNDVVVAADTVVDVDGIAYNKPLDAADARRMLRDLSGRTHAVHTALAISAGGTIALESESTHVTFFPLEDAEIDRYIESGEPFDKAGAYGIQAHGASLVERISGDFYTVMGFPLARFVRTLRRLGFVLPITN
ncbi:MAG TPA: Maf family nucleotide pyrophosphatase [Candidatus Rubrimentiphilum sp.]|nr:Maf family nucleotide pyrophosphatase [Candidatus Rubrimentiphilum sp.]